MTRLPIPRIERRSRDSVLIDAEEGCRPRIVGRAHLLTKEERSIHCADGDTWRTNDQPDLHFYLNRVEAEDAMVRRHFGDYLAVPVIDRRKTR